MLLRLLAYWGLAVDALARGEWILALLCFATPFLGPIGMWTAGVVGVWFMARGQFIEGIVALGVLAFILLGNEVMTRHTINRRNSSPRSKADIPNKQTNTKLENTIQLGGYRLGQHIREARGLRELSANEYEREIIGEDGSTKGNRIFHGHNIDFVGFSWETELFTKGAEVYKITIHCNAPSQDEASMIFKRTSDYLNQEVGPQGNTEVGSSATRKHIINGCVWELPGNKITLTQVTVYIAHGIGLVLEQTPNIQSHHTNDK